MHEQHICVHSMCCVFISLEPAGSESACCDALELDAAELMGQVHQSPRTHPFSCRWSVHGLLQRAYCSKHRSCHKMRESQAAMKATPLQIKYLVQIGVIWHRLPVSCMQHTQAYRLQSVSYPVGASLLFRLSSVKAVVYKLHRIAGEFFSDGQNQWMPSLQESSAHLPQKSATPAVASEPTRSGLLHKL